MVGWAKAICPGELLEVLSQAPAAARPLIGSCREPRLRKRYDQACGGIQGDWQTLGYRGRFGATIGFIGKQAVQEREQTPQYQRPNPLCAMLRGGRWLGTVRL